MTLHVTDNSYVARHVNTIEQHNHAVIINGGSHWGAPYIAEALRQNSTPFIWLKLEFDDQDDAVEQGNKLADALAHALGAPLFGYGFSYRYGLSILREHLALLAPLRIMLSGAQHSLALACELLTLQQFGNQVLLEFDEVPAEFVIPEDALVLTPDALRLSMDDAVALVSGRLSEQEVRALLDESKGAYERFLLLRNRALTLPVHLRPAPTHPEPLPDVATLAPRVHLGSLLRRELWIEAFELAALQVPSRVPDFIEQAGDAFIARGTYERFWRLLNALPDKVKAHEDVLKWRLRIANRLGLQESLRAETEHHLSEHEAPDVRAFYAMYLAPKHEALLQAERAYRAAKTPNTTRIYGITLTHDHPAKSLRIFQESLKITEPLGDYPKIVLAMSMMTYPSIQLGHYREAAYWAEEGIRLYDQQGLGDWQLRLNLMNQVAYSRILLGETAGLESRLQQDARHPDISLALTVRSTMGDLMLAKKQPEEALKYYQMNYDLTVIPNWDKGFEYPLFVVLDMVRCLLALGDVDQAGSIARRYYYLTRHPRQEANLFGALTHGMVQSLIEPSAGIDLLQEALRGFLQPLAAPYLAVSGLYLARAQLALGQDKAAAETLRIAEPGLRELSDVGMQFLVGAEYAFQPLFRFWQGETTPLVLRFLGSTDVIMKHETLSLTRYWREILTLLALHPEGLSGEQLLAGLHGDDGKVSNLKSVLSKLRRVIEISRAPYRLLTPFSADFLQIETHLKEGRVRAALELYKGPLLPESDAPGIREAREQLEERLRRSILKSGDAEALLSLAERLRDDLSLWEAALQVLPAQDPRRTLVKARYEQLADAYTV